MGEFEILGTRLKLLRKRLKVNQMQFSKMISISSATLSAYETGVKNPSLAVLKNIAETCNVSIDWLCGLSEKESLSNSDSIKTYSDVIKILVEIEKHITIECDISYYRDISSEYNQNPEKEACINFSFFDGTLARFGIDWDKMIELHSSGIIDDNLYSLWINQQLDLYKFDLPNKNINIFNNKVNKNKIDGSKVNVDEIDDDLPF